MSVTAEVAKLLIAAGKTIALAESCTCGLVAYRLSTVPGASRYLKGGVVAYANSVKEAVLGVPREAFEDGAVSPKVALEMASRVRHLLGADIGVANTGLAGPGGGTLEKPVGLTYVALVAADGVQTCARYLWQDQRESNKEHTAQAVLEMVKQYLEKGSFERE